LEYVCSAPATVIAGVIRKIMQALKTSGKLRTGTQKTVIYTKATQIFNYF